jgi:hypothetical protein
VYPVGPAVMPFQALVDIAGNADIVSFRVRQAAEDIDEPSSYATHVRVWQRRICTRRRRLTFRVIKIGPRSVYAVSDRVYWRGSVITAM